jgi:hypothetical protein
MLPDGVAEPVEPIVSADELMATVASTEVARLLNHTVAPDHNWAAIFFVLMAYTGVVCIANFFVARKWGDTRITFTVFLLSLALACWAVGRIGRRGYGERTTASTVCLARVLGPGRYDVEQWANLFVTDGDAYHVQPEGEWSLVSTAKTFETAEGYLRCGPGGYARLVIPMYSSQKLVHRTVRDGPALWAVASAVPEELSDLELSLEGEVPPGGQIVDAYAVQNGLTVDLLQSFGSEEPDSLTLTATGEDSVPVETILLDQYNGHYYPSGYAGQHLEVDEVMHAAGKNLLLHALSSRLPEREDHITLFLLVDQTPPALLLNAEAFAQEKSKILYQLPVGLREETTDE